VGNVNTPDHRIFADTGSGVAKEETSLHQNETQIARVDESVKGIIRILAGKARKAGLVTLQAGYNRVAPGRAARREDKFRFSEKLNAFFDAIFVITLERNQQRQQFMRKSLDGIQYRFVDGVDGRKIDSLQKASLYSLEKNRSTWPFDLKDNEIGCALSHARLYERIVKERIRKCLILEDDALIEERRTLAALLDNLPADWEVVRMGYGTEYPASYLLEGIEGLIRLAKPGYRIARVRTRTVKKYLRTAGHHNCTVAYAVTLEAARKLLGAVYPIATLPDHFLDLGADTGLVKSFHAVPRIFNDATDLLGSSI
jgi:glycosyl transferase family 25